MAVPNMKQQVAEAESGFPRTGKQEEQLEAPDGIRARGETIATIRGTRSDM
jgi:hypothetical protein